MSIVEKPKGQPFDNGPKRPDGQYEKYAVLPKEERDKGFIRPVRQVYKHVGPPGPMHPLRDLTKEEHERYDSYGYVKFEEFQIGEATLGKFWTQEEMDAVIKGGCGTVTHMGLALSETYARDPSYYGSTFCCGCQTHLPVIEFVWDGTEERVGS
jgi:hypothetical protein